MYYHVEFDVAAVILTIFIAYFIFFKKGLARHANRVYLVLIGLVFLSEVSDICSSLINNDPDSSNRLSQDVWNYVYLTAHNALAYCFTIYLFFVLGVVKRKRREMYLVTIPFLGDLALLISNPFNGLTFYYDAEGYYRHGPLFTVMYGIAVIYMVLSVSIVIRHRKQLDRSRCRALLAFLIMASVPVFIQMFYQEYLLTLFFESVGLLGILFSIENKEDTISPVTGMLNRFAMEPALDAAMSGNSTTMILIKIPNLNYYNKSIGYENMNDILSRISVWLEKQFVFQTCYDCGRGHFAVLCEGIREETIEKSRREVFERFEQPWGKGTFSLTFPVQFGVIRLPEDVGTIENLQILIEDPFDGKESMELNAAKLLADYERRVIVEQLIDKALKNKSFVVWYQPIWDSHTGKVRSAEALCRLRDEEYGLIPPDEFIPIAEQNGTILEIGKIVFEEVCRTYQEQDLKKLGLDYIEVNLSVVQCMSNDLKEVFKSILDKYSLDASCINLEVTESATATNQKTMVDNINRLNKMGFAFSLDDYGTGYSNISYMYDMPFSIIKIDKSILWKAMDPVSGEGQRGARIFLENTIRMLKEMDYAVLVEGVETLEQKMLLEEFGCDYFQGYYFSKPVEKNVFRDYVRVVNA